LKYPVLNFCVGVGQRGLRIKGVKCIRRNPFLAVLCRVARIPLFRCSDKRDLTVLAIANIYSLFSDNCLFISYAIAQWFLTGRARPPGGVKKLKGGGIPYMLYNMWSFEWECVPCKRYASANVAQLHVILVLFRQRWKSWLSFLKFCGPNLSLHANIHGRN